MKPKFESMMCLKIFTFILLSSLLTAACKKENVAPTTGDVVVLIRRSGLIGVDYSVFSEAYLSAKTFVPPLAKGTIYGTQIRIEGLNAGNYILELNASTNWRIAIQVTAGKERTFSID